ncbi:MAG: nuclease-related domain-containing protein [Planctomycetaceae bacterium]
MKNSAVSANRDPIKRLPLRNPGQSIEDQIAKFRAETIDVWIVMLIFAVVLMLWEWYWYLIPIQSGPVPITLMCLGVIFYSVVRIRQERETLEQLKLGLKGEQATGQYLQNSLLRQGYWVVHDICFDDFNIDHALIGPAGCLRSKRRLDQSHQGIRPSPSMAMPSSLPVTNRIVIQSFNPQLRRKHCKASCWSTAGQKYRSVLSFCFQDGSSETAS